MTEEYVFVAMLSPRGKKVFNFLPPRLRKVVLFLDSVSSAIFLVLVGIFCLWLVAITLWSVGYYGWWLLFGTDK